MCCKLKWDGWACHVAPICQILAWSIETNWKLKLDMHALQSLNIFWIVIVYLLFNIILDLVFARKGLKTQSWKKKIIFNIFE